MSAHTQPAIATILFTDIVGSTELIQRVGDERAQRLIQAHHRRLQDSVTATGGGEVQRLGDGLMPVFASTADAVRGAIAPPAQWRRQHKRSRTPEGPRSGVMSTRTQRKRS